MYLKIPNTYPYNIAQLYSDNPETSFPDEMPNERLAEWGVYPVILKSRPETSSGMVAEEIFPVNLAGIWTQQWLVRDLTFDELEDLASNIRAERTRLLQESDWTQVADAPVDKTAWAIYRQALRDVTAQPDFPTIVNWPTKPE